MEVSHEHFLEFGVNGDFATSTNWNPAVVPGPADEVILGAKRTYTVTSPANETIDSLTIADKHATLFITGASNFATTNGGVNDGTIIADSGSRLTIGNIGLPTSFENSGTLEAKNTNNLPTGGSLFVTGTITNTPQGVIEANGANTLVTLAEVTIVGGTLETRGANAVIDILPFYVTLDGTQAGNPVNIAGHVQVGSEDDLFLMGTINNTGVITVVGGVLPWIIIQGNVTLEGGGDITLTNPSGPLALAGAIFGGVLTNVDNTISGTGEIGHQTLAGSRHFH